MAIAIIIATLRQYAADLPLSHISGHYYYAITNSFRRQYAITLAPRQSYRFRQLLRRHAISVGSLPFTLRLRHCH